MCRQEPQTQPNGRHIHTEPAGRYVYGRLWGIYYMGKYGGVYSRYRQEGMHRHRIHTGREMWYIKGWQGSSRW